MNFTLDELIPQKRTMRLIDTLSNYGDGFVECQVHLQPKSLFSIEDYVPSWVGIEYMAQTVAAYAGIRRIREGLAPGIGLLIGVRNYRVQTDRFDVGGTLIIRAVEEYRDQEMGIYACSIHTVQNLSLATATLKGYMGAIKI